MNLHLIGYLMIAFLLGSNVSMFAMEYFFLRPARKRTIELMNQLISMNELCITLINMIPDGVTQKDGSVLSPIQIKRPGSK